MASRAAEQALAAHRERLAATPVEKRETFAERSDREWRERVKRAGELLPNSPPAAEWFPDVEWDVMDFGAPGTSDQYQGDGSEFYIAPSERDFTLWVGWRAGKWEVQFVWRHQATPPYEHEGAYWTGVKVHCAADVGAALEKRPGASDGA
jgi:hypothetical protein